MIFQFLGIWDLVECRRVCKPWKQIVDSGSLLATIDFRDIEWNEEKDIELLNFALFQTSSSAYSLKLSPCPLLTDTFANKWFSKVGNNLMELNLPQSNKLTVDIVNSFLKYCPQIQKLDLSNLLSSVSNKSSILSKICDHFSLQSLAIEGINDEDLDIILSHTKNSLVSLSIPRSSEVSSQGIMKFVTNYSNLKELNISFCESISISIVKELTDKLPKLYSTHCPEDFEVYLSPELENLTLVEIRPRAEIEYSFEDILSVIKLFPDLEEVDSRFLFSGSLETAENVFLNYGFKPTIVGSSEEEEDEEDEESGEEELICEICHKTSENGLLKCEKCNRAYHNYCLRPPLKEIPSDEWFCGECKMNTGSDQEDNYRTSKKRKFMEVSEE